MAAGKFQGVIAAQTPTGSRVISRRLSDVFEGRISPLTRRACSENHSTNDGGIGNFTQAFSVRLAALGGNQCGQIFFVGLNKLVPAS